MKKYIILSVNDNPDYLFHVPLTCWAWRKFGWEPLILFRAEIPNSDLAAWAFGNVVEVMGDEFTGLRLLLNMGGYKSETIAQVSRLYASCIADGYLMTGDIDMLPLSDYWKPDFDKLTVWGRDLTDYHYPICYIGAPSWMWSEIMQLNYDDYNELIKRDLDSLPQAKGNDKVKRWVTDQDLITERINNSRFVPERVDRGTDKRTGYPVGRIDRSNWLLDHKQFIDCHMFHGIQRDESKYQKTLEMLRTVWPNEDFKWFEDYTKEFKKLCQI